MTLKKGLLILELFLTQKEEVSLTEIVNLTKINFSTAYRICQILEKQGYLTRNSRNKKYSLGPMILSLGASLFENNALLNAAAPHMRSLSETVKEVITLGIVTGHKVLIVNRIEVDRILIPKSNIGDKLDLHCTAIGKVLLAGLQDSKLDEILNTINFERFTKYTITSKDKLLKHIESVRLYGYAVNNMETNEEIRAISAPIRAAGGIVIAGIAIDVPAHRITISKLKTFAPETIETAKLISKDMGYTNN